MLRSELLFDKLCTNCGTHIKAAVVYCITVGVCYVFIDGVRKECLFRIIGWAKNK